VNVNRSDISQIQKYLNGELDARAMYELELRAQNDPMLMDVMAGMEAAHGNHQPHLDAIDQLVKQRVARDKIRVLPIFKYWAAAASVMLMLGIGGWWFTRQLPGAEIEKNMARQLPLKKGRITAPVIGQAATPAPGKHATPVISKKSHTNVKGPVGAVPETKMPHDSTGNQLAINKRAPDDKIIRGYVSRSREQATGSSYVITDKKVQDNPVGNVEQLLQGKVAGLNIQNKTEEAPANGKRVVTGRVTDALTGEPLAGATIAVGGKGLAQADINGKFKVIVPDSTQDLTVTFVSYAPQNVKLGKTSDFGIQLNQSTLALNETVIRGYIKRNREQTTGSSYIITGKEVSDLDKKTTQQDLRYGGKVPGKFLPLLNPKRVLKPGECYENIRFKKKFFDHMAAAEKFTLEHIRNAELSVSDSRMIKALKFISGYTKVSVALDDKVKVGYSDLDTFIADKTNWLKWYEANKCNNLK
jgi:hypothetical protein